MTDTLKRWLLETSVPMWLAHGVDRRAGAFTETLDPATRGCAAPFRRLRVAARQTYVFARAASHGVAGADAATALGMDFLTRHAALPDGGYARSFTLANTPTDTTQDLYDLAFVLLALSTAAAILPPAPLRARALALSDLIETRFAHPAGGYLESLPPSQPRRQNPHMHLLEALLAAAEAFPDGPFLARANTLLALFATRLFHAPTGTLPEFFTDELTPLPAGATHLTEPGHHYEWAWLLHRAARLGATPHPAQAQALLDFANTHASHPITGDVIDSLHADATHRTLTARLWPQTERLKTLPAGARAEAARLQTWLHPDGLWTERRDATGAQLATPAPATSLYHLTCAILQD